MSREPRLCTESACRNVEDECRGKDVSCLFEEINEWVVMVREEKRICMYVNRDDKKRGDSCFVRRELDWDRV